MIQIAKEMVQKLFDFFSNAFDRYQQRKEEERKIIHYRYQKGPFKNDSPTK